MIMMVMMMMTMMMTMMMMILYFLLFIFIFHSYVIYQHYITISFELRLVKNKKLWELYNPANL